MDSDDDDDEDDDEEEEGVDAAFIQVSGNCVLSSRGKFVW